MKIPGRKRLSALVLAVLMLTGILLSGCGKAAEDTPKAAVLEDGKTYGKGASAFTLSVTDAAGVRISAQILTDQATVAQALQELGVISGRKGPNGLVVETVGENTLQWNRDHRYWAFYIDDVYADISPDAAKVTPGTVYSFRAEG